MRSFCAKYLVEYGPYGYIFTKMLYLCRKLAAEDNIFFNNNLLTFLSFQDEVLADGKVVIDLIDAIKPGAINYDLVLSGATDEVSYRILL